MCLCMFEFVQFIYYTSSPKSHFTRSDRLQCLSTFTLSTSIRCCFFPHFIIFFYCFFFCALLLCPCWLWFSSIAIEFGWLFMELCQFTRHMLLELCSSFAILFHRNRPPVLLQHRPPFSPSRMRVCDGTTCMICVVCICGE